MKKILIVNVNWLGDVLFSTPLLKAIREKYKDAYIVCMIVPRCKEVLEGNPHLDELIIYDEENVHKGIAGKLRFVSELRKKNFNEALFLHRSLTRTFLVALARVPKRIGYYTKKRSFLLTEKPLSPEGKLHRMDLFCELGDNLGVKVKNRVPEFYIEDEDHKYIERLLEKNGISQNDRVVVLNPGGNWPPKRWPIEHFARLANILVNEFGAKVVITGEGKDEALARDIARQSGVSVYSTCGKTNLKQLGALMERASLVISNDSGPLHIATAMGTKAIALFGPTSPDVTGPRGKGKIVILQKGVGCSIPCYVLSCKDNRCMKAITVEDVIECAREILDPRC